MKYYCLGIKGAGMSTLANILHDLGNEVSGYDDARATKYTEEGLNKRGIKIYYEGPNLPKDTIITYSKAMGEDHKELKRVRDLGFTIKAYNEIVGDITKQFRTIGVSGTHGKTTTSFMLSHIIDSTLGCSYFVGDGTGKGDKNSDILVIESDEYNKHFLAYLPEVAIITNIELDHVECYDGLEDIKNTFVKFGNKSKLVVACGDDTNIKDISFSKDVVYYGFEEHNDMVAKNVEIDFNGCKFDVYDKGNFLDSFYLPVAGYHMVLNALATIISCKHFGISNEEIKKHMATYETAKRRFKEEVINDIVIIDDYAHHPTEIKVTLETAKLKYPNKELVAVFLPNTYSRTEALKEDFIHCFFLADKTYIMDIQCNREVQEDYPNTNSNLLIDNIDNSENIEVETSEKLLKHKDAVICFMSCANISNMLNTYRSLLIKHK